MIVTATSLSLPFAAGTFHAALGSPPYWGGLRVYSGPQVRPWPAIAYCPMPGLPPVEIPAQAVPLGHEQDPFAFVGHLLQVYREVRRTLRPEGVLAVNLGDCYSSSPHQNHGAGSSTLTGGRSKLARSNAVSVRVARRSLEPKNLLLMPWRFALAMQADGWVLRSRMPGGIEMEPDIVWKKSSTMPESVRDRPTNDFEDVLIFAQGPRYFWDQEAGREEASQPLGAPALTGQRKAAVLQDLAASTLGTNQGRAGRNMRATWTINPEPTDEEHYASWPVELAARLIRVTTSERGCCPECGAPWERVVEREAILERPRSRPGRGEQPSLRAGPGQAQQGGRYVSAQTLGWRPTCAHDAEPVPCRVLDPFAGLGRTWEAARETGRRFAGSDLSLEYCRIARSRSVLEAAERRRAAEAKRVRTITGPLFDEEPRTPSPGA